MHQRSPATICPDSETFQAAVADLRFDHVVSSSGPFPARVLRAAVGQLRLLTVDEPGARLGIVHVDDDTALIVCPTRQATSQAWQGIALRPGELMFVAPGARLHHLMRRAGSWAWVAAPVRVLFDGYADLIGERLMMPKAESVVRPPRSSFAALAALREDVAELAASAPERLVNPEVARALEQELIATLVGCLAASPASYEPKRRVATRLRHGAILARFDDCLALQLQQPRSIGELAQDIAVPARTLRSICGRFAGLTPRAYLLAVRLRAARALLRETAPATTAVAPIIRSLGFRRLGRFADDYRRAFGESPETTLRGALDRPLARTVGRDVRGS